jgi:hypothetical protein
MPTPKAILMINLRLLIYSKVRAMRAMPAVVPK